MPSVSLLIVSLCYIALSVVCGCVIANWCWLYKAIEAHPAFFHRNPRATLTFGRASVIFFWLTNPIAILVYQLGFHNGALEVIHVLLNITVNNSLAWIIWYRVYLTFWDVQVSLALTDEQWAAQVDSTYSHSNFYLEWRRTFGSSKAVSNYSLVWFSLLSLFQIIVIAGNPGNRGQLSLLLELAGYAVVLLHVAVLIFFLPRFDDYFNIRGEMIRLTTLMFGSVLVCFVFILSVNLRPPSIWFLLYNLLLSSFTFLMNFLQFGLTFYDWNYPLLIVKPSQLRKLVSESEMKYGLVMPSQPSLTANANGKLSGGMHGRMAAGEVSQMMEKVRRMPGAKGRERGKSAGDRRSKLSYMDGVNYEKYSVRDVIEDSEGFSLFCRHLSREFSPHANGTLGIENILFLIEVQQFISKCAEDMKAAGKIPNFDEELHLVFPKSVPKSSIVSGFNSVETHRSTNPLKFQDRLHLSDPYVQCIRLFLKYIPTEAPFGINISFHNRERLYAFFRFDDKSQTFNELKYRGMEIEHTPSLFGFSDDLSVTRGATLTETDVERMERNDSDTETVDNGLSSLFGPAGGMSEPISVAIDAKRSTAAGTSSLSAMFSGGITVDTSERPSLRFTVTPDPGDEDQDDEDDDDGCDPETDVEIDIDDALVAGAGGNAADSKLAARMARHSQLTHAKELIVPHLTHSESDMPENRPLRTDKYMNEEETWDTASMILKKSLPKENRLMTIWNLSQREIIRLLNDSLVRFSQTEGYKRWHKAQKFARLASAEHSIKRTRSNPIGFKKGTKKGNIDSSRSNITRGMSFAGIS